LIHDESLLSPLPGTIVDSSITGREKKDFFLIGHKAVQGSAKPVHFIVFKDEFSVKREEIMDFIFRLCHLHPGCTRSVSLPAPLYNAHKLAYRIGQVYRAAFEAAEDDNLPASFQEIILPSFIKTTAFFL